MERIINFEGKRHVFPADATDAEIEEALSLRAAQIGTEKGGASTPEKRLEILRAQLSDPSRNMAFDADLKAELARVAKTIGSQPPAAPRPSQADVRASEVPLSAKENQRVNETAFEAARQEYLKKHGTLPRGKTQAQSISEFSGLPDPETTREQNMVEHAYETDEVEYENTPGYTPLKIAAGVGGFALGGPAGATVAESGVRYLALTQNLDKAVKAGAITEDRAWAILKGEMTKGGATDAAWNFGVPLLGHLVSKVPGAKWLGTKLESYAAEKLAGRRLPLTDDPARKEAVEALAKRGGDHIPTPGQVTGDAGITESAVRRASPGPFKRQEKALTGAADDMLRETTSPAGQMTREELGETITRLADDTQRAVKQRLRPAFQAADDLGVRVDVRPVRLAVSKALREDAKVAGGRLKPAERADLEKVFDDLRLNPSMTAEATLDFISRRKEVARAMTADGVPSKEFTGLMTRLAGLADGAYTSTARAVGQPKVAADLLRARRQYGDMIDTVYEDAMKQALKKVSPEDIGRLFWQPGNVTEIKQLHRMLRLAEREGVVGAAGAQKVKQDVARGFLQEGVRDVESAAKWLDEIKQNPLKRDTWNALTTGPEGKALRHAMEVVSHAAQIASKSGFELAGGTIIPLQRAAGGGMGQSYVTGALRPGMVALGFSIVGVTRMLATAYTRGDTGVINLVARVLRANSAATGASAKAMQTLLPELEKAAKKYGADIFAKPAEEGEPQ